MVPGDATGDDISELTAVQIPAETDVWQGEWRQTFSAVCMGYFRQTQREGLYTACVKVRTTLMLIGC